MYNEYCYRNYIITTTIWISLEPVIVFSYKITKCMKINLNICVFKLEDKYLSTSYDKGKQKLNS